MNKGLRISLISVGLIATVVAAVDHAIDSANPAAIVVATELYDSCLVGFTQAKDWPTNLPDIQAQAKELDTICTQWASALLVGFHPSGESELTLAERLLWADERKVSQAFYIKTLSTNIK